MSFHVVAANLIERDGDYLLVQEGKDSVRGEWNLPAGGVDQEERIKDAAVREAKEETGLYVELESFLGVFVDESDRSDSTVLIFVFSASPKDFEFETPGQEEILDVKLFSPEDFQDLNIRIPFLEEAVRRYEEGETLDLESVEDFRN